jgi:hypothetical protein
MQHLKWIKEGYRYTLKSDETFLMTLHIYPAAGAAFILNEKEYVISTKGIWNPSIYVTTSGKEILKLTHSIWSSKGKILFNDGTEYYNEYTSKGGLQLRFTDAGNEILSYAVAFENKRPLLKFTLGNEMIDAEKLLILAALGMTLFSSAFREIAGENDITTVAMLLTVI